MKLKNKRLKKKKTEAILSESLKVRLISQTYNLWNPRHGHNQEVQIQTNLILNDEIGKQISI
jgi:hypothetical protein